MNTTLNYYDKNATTFATTTLCVDFQQTQDRFLNKLAQDGKILDFGCSAGRGTKYFLARGYDVVATDSSEERCKIASRYLGIVVKRMLFQELADLEVYDGIWACSSILHLPKPELWNVPAKMCRAVKNEGIIYTSFLAAKRIRKIMKSFSIPLRICLRIIRL